MFGAVCSGRPIQLASQVEPTKYVIQVPNATNVSHIAIFLLPNTEFTDTNYTALVYFQLPDSQEFKLLGGLNPAKPSAIFKLNNKKQQSNSAQVDDIDMSIDAGTAAPDSAILNIGIAIEPTAQAEVQLAQERERQAGLSLSLVPASTVARPPLTLKSATDIAALANRIVTHAYNFLGSFVDDSGKVPMKAFDSWWEKFKSKLANNPDFLDDLQ